MTQKRENAPEGTQSNYQIDCTPREPQSHAEFLFSQIKTGRDNALKRPKGSTDRRLRLLIAKANMTGDCIINVGDGYFRPGRDDGPVFNQYMNMERHRAIEMSRKLQRMQEAYNNKGGNL